jgi:hypothetical protein
MRIIYCLFIYGAAALSIPQGQLDLRKNLQQETRADFVEKFGIIVGSSVLACVPVAEARGRATLDQSYERYVPRIISGGEFYKLDLRKMIEKNDWQAIKAATAEPPAKSKADRSKADGGVAERAAQAGKFSDARVLVAADLFAAAFSDNSISAKTQNMKDQVVVLREVVEGINQAAREALGETSGGGGLFGFGSKQRSQAELSKIVRELYVKGGNAYNKYVFAANDELPLSLQKLPYLS